MAIQFSMIRDINGYNGFGILFSDVNYSSLMTVGLAATITIPYDFENWLAIFSIDPGSRIWVANNQTAVAPTDASFGSTYSQLNPTARQVKAGDVLSLITPDTSAYVGVSLYGLL